MKTFRVVMPRTVCTVSIQNMNGEEVTERHIEKAIIEVEQRINTITSMIDSNILVAARFHLSMPVNED